jgi:hypothetical protein
MKGLLAATFVWMYLQSPAFKGELYPDVGVTSLLAAEKNHGCHGSAMGSLFIVLRDGNDKC